MIKTIIKTMAAAAAGLTLFGQAHAVVDIFTVEEGGDVKFTFSGSIDLTGLTEGTTTVQDRGQVGPNQGYFISIPDVARTVWAVENSWTPFGTGGDNSNGISSGDAFAMFTNPSLGLPPNYVSGSNLSGIMVFVGETFASLGMAIGVYSTDIGNGDMVNVYIGDVAPVPVPAAAPLMLAGLAAFGLRKRRKAA
ncbi:MAG: VPLPA-CTERM sorting domain-containing protein [Parvularculaceae bacterium]|nr:VPLPA-CTERM sorting domain-containing protein [Parvularculaceae bacterium]